MRKPKAPETNRAQILAAAIAEFASRGFKGASMDAIAARTNTTRALINYYFGSKEKLYLAVLERVYAEIREAENASRPRAPAAGGGDPPHRRVHVQLLRRARVLRADRGRGEPGQGAAHEAVPGAAHRQPPHRRHARRGDRARAGRRHVPRRTPIRSTSTCRSRRWGCSTSRISTPSAPSSSGPWARREMCPQRRRMVADMVLSWLRPESVC